MIAGKQIGVDDHGESFVPLFNCSYFVLFRFPGNFPAPLFSGPLFIGDIKPPRPYPSGNANSNASSFRGQDSL